MIVPVQNRRATVSEERKEDIDELDRIEKFYLSGCSCQLAQGTPCCKSIQKSHYEEYRNNCVEMTKQELDMVVMGQIVVFTNRSTKTLHVTDHRHLTDKERERESSTFKHEGTQIPYSGFVSRWKTFVVWTSVIVSRLNFRERESAPCHATSTPCTCDSR